MGRHSKIAIAAIFIAYIAYVSAVCEDDLVPLENGQLAAVWNIGNMDNVFFNSVHLRGVLTTRNYNLTGLDTVTTSLHFCPVDMTIYGNVTVRRFQIIGNYQVNFDYINHGSQLFAHGDGFGNMTFTNLQLRNIVAPIRYSAKLKRLQLDHMKYEVHADVLPPVVTGLELDEAGGHTINGEEYVKVDQTSSFPTATEIVRAIVNSRVKVAHVPVHFGFTSVVAKGILVGAVKEMFAKALSL